MSDHRWLTYALLSAACAASISIFGKVGMKGIDPHLATAVRSVVQAAFVGAFAAYLGSWSTLGELRSRPVAAAMIACCGVAGGLSWIFYFNALSLAQVSQVGPVDKLSMPLGVLLAVVLLGDRPSAVNWCGILLIAAGVYLTTWPRPGGEKRPATTGPREVREAIPPATPARGPAKNDDGSTRP